MAVTGTGTISESGESSFRLEGARRADIMRWAVRHNVPLTSTAGKADLVKEINGLHDNGRLSLEAVSDLRKM